MTDIVGVVPAAGHATRLQPLRCSKEVLPVGGAPVMDYLVRRMRAGGCSRIRVVTRPDKQDVIAHSVDLGAEVVLAVPETVSESFWAGMSDLDDDDIVLMGFPDTIWEPEDGYARLVEAVRGDREVALGLFTIAASDLHRSDVVVMGEGGTVARIDVKPSHPESDSIWGCAAARLGALEGLVDSDSPGSYFDGLCREGRDVAGIVLSDVWIDVGTQSALERARRRDP